VQGRSRAARILIACAAVAFGSGVVAPSASALARETPAIATGSSEAQALARLDSIRSQFAQGGVASSVLAAADSVGVSVPDVPLSTVTAPAGTPPSLAPSVGALLGAIQTAANLVHEAIHITPSQATGLIQQNDALMREVNQAVLTGQTSTMEASLTSTATTLQSEAAAAVDRPMLYSGALLIAQTIDQRLPSMRAASTQPQPSQTAPASGCDIVDDPPLLCIGSGHNHYTQDYDLLISEGGYDTFTNAAGGADPLTNGPVVSVVIDLGGHDQYFANNELTTGPAPADIGVQGTGQYGIGMLIDAGGSNTYTATTDSTADNSIIAQGTGALGVGVLDDMGGNSSFNATNTGALDLVDVIAQGFATLGGMGILMEGGGGTNNFVMHGQPAVFTDPTGAAHAGTAQTRGFGWGVLGGAALWSDSGGTNTLYADALSPAVPPGVTNLAMVPSPVMQGFGFAATGGAATVLAGSGQNTYDAVADDEGSQLGEATVNAYGMGGEGASGALYDAGGSDTFIARAIDHAVTTATVDDSCGCAGVTAKAVSNGAIFIGQGVGVLAGTGILEDESGNTTYDAYVDASAVASAVDDRTQGAPGDTGADAAASVNNAGSFAQGWGDAGAGYLIDGGGDDQYTSTLSGRTNATASAPHLPADPLSAQAQTAYMITQAQAASELGGDGALTHQTGSNAYTVSTTASAVASPPTQATVQPISSLEQGGVSDSAATFTGHTQPDSVDVDVFNDTPPDPACQGTRGSGVWVDCGPGLGTGIDLASGNPGAAVPEARLAPLLLLGAVSAWVGFDRRRRRNKPG
jgi:hypothetical protein